MIAQSKTSNFTLCVLVLLFASLWLASQVTCDGCMARRLVDHGNIGYHQEGINLCRELRADGHCQVSAAPSEWRVVIERVLRDIYADTRGIQRLPPGQ